MIAQDTVSIGLKNKLKVKTITFEKVEKKKSLKKNKQSIDSSKVNDISMASSQK